MRVFISYSHQDKKHAMLIAEQLKAEDHEVWFDSWSLKLGDNLLKKISEGIETADVLILLISKNTAKSKWVMHEFSAIAFNELSKQKQRIIPVIIDKGPIPNYLSQYLYVDMSSDFKLGVQKLIASLAHEGREETDESVEALQKEQKQESRDAKISELAKALHGGRLTLVCGAGVSVDAGVPTWNDLLLRLLGTMITRISTDHSLSMSGSDADKFHSRYSPSSLVVGKYLKNNLGKDFLKELREALYTSDPETCDILNSIVNLSRPQRDGKPLDSIITFNFDALLEENLDQQNIKYKTVYGEGVRNAPNELPVYHVHGFYREKAEYPKVWRLYLVKMHTIANS